MKFLVEQIKRKSKKALTFCLAMLLSITMLPQLASSLPVEAESTSNATVFVTFDTTKEYTDHMYTSGYTAEDYGKDKQRIVEFSVFLNSLNPGISAIDSTKVDEHETKTIKWHPSQKDIDDNRDLYLLEWTNGYYKSNPGSGYEILGRIVYLDNNNIIRYTPMVNIDSYPRKLQGFGEEAQWNQGRINQALFAMPENCKQILAISMINESGGGNNNNIWWMDNCFISRITSDSMSDVSTHFTNAKGFVEYNYSNAELVGFVSSHDISQRYLDGDDTSNEWLYLLQTPTARISSSAKYYAQIVTADRTDLSNKGLKLEINYTNISGVQKTHTMIISDETVDNTYPVLAQAEGVDDSSKEFASSTLRYFHNITGYWQQQKTAHSFIWKTFAKLNKSIERANDVALELYPTNDQKTSLYVRDHLGSFADFRFEDAYFTEMNTTAMTYFGNFVNYTEMKEAMLSGYAATDIALNLDDVVVSIESVKLSLNAGENATLQDIRIYAADYDDVNKTKMNGGLSVERVFANANDAECLASLDTSYGLINLNGSGLVTCTPTSENTQASRKLLVHTNKCMNFATEDDNLGVVISFADIYDAGLESFSHGYSDALHWPATSTDYKEGDRLQSTNHIKTFFFAELVKYGYLDSQTSLELINVMESYFKESLTLTITYVDDFGCTRRVEIPFVTTYMLQLYSDNGGKLGTNNQNHITGVFQQGEDIAVRVPLSQYGSVISVDLSFGKSPEGIYNFKSNKHYYVEDNRVDYNPGTGSSSHNRETWVEENVSSGNIASYEDIIATFAENETIANGTWLPYGDTISIRAIRLYEHVTKDNFKIVYNGTRRTATPSITKQSDYYFAASNKNGYVFAGTEQSLTLSESAGTLTRGNIDYADKDIVHTYIVEIKGQSITPNGHSGSSLMEPPENMFATLSYTTTGGEQIKTDNKAISDFSYEFNGYSSMKGKPEYPTAPEIQSRLDLKEGTVVFTLDLENVSSFDSIFLSLPDGVTRGWQANSITIYDASSLGKRYAKQGNFYSAPSFAREYSGTQVAFNNKPAALQPKQEGKIFYFSKVNSDGTIVTPDIDTPYTDEYLTVPPTSMSYAETLKNLGLAITKYTYTVDVDVANVIDAGSSNYFYFQLVFENGTSGVVLANQQLTADSFRQGYTESFTISTTQNYGNLTSIRVICDTTSSTSQVFDKLNIEKVTVSLPSNGGAKSWIMDKVGWIDINYQDDGVNTTVVDAKETGFPNSMVIKEFARTRTASTARLLFNISTSSLSTTQLDSTSANYEGVLTYVDTAGYTQNHHFDLKTAMFNYMENTSFIYLFRPNMSNYFTLSLNDISSVKSLSIYRADGKYDWIIKDISISQFTDLGDVYLSTTGEFQRYVENETLITTSTNQEQTIKENGNATFMFNEHSISIDTSSASPETWTTTITRLPVSTQETMNIYLYENGTETFDAENFTPVKGRLEYTLKDNGSIIGSESFSFTELTTVNGVKALKATGVKVTGMNQLRTMYLLSEYDTNPSISGVQVERIRGNTIVERLYFDFNEETLLQGKTLSASAVADLTASKTKQTLTLQVSNGQKQIFNVSNNIAVALLYTSENDAVNKQKTLYSSPYVFFTDAGITSLNNTSIIEIPFEIYGVDQIAGFSIVSTGPNVSFDNALIYNYMETSNGELILMDSCPIIEKISTSTNEKQFISKDSVSVTPVTLEFTTSSDAQFHGAGSSGRIPMTINYKDFNGQDVSVSYDNMLNLTSSNTVPSANSTIAVKVHLPNLSSLTSISLSVLDDNWHLYKVTATMDKYVHDVHIPTQTEAFIDGWITPDKPATVKFGDNTQNSIISFSIAAIATTSGSVETATNGEVLKIKAIPNEEITLTPHVTVEGAPDNTVIWDTTKLSEYMSSDGEDGMIFTVPSTHNGISSVGQVFTFTSYCSYDKEKTITVSIEVVKAPENETENGTDTEPEETLPEDEEVTVSGTITTGAAEEVAFELEDGDSFVHYVAKDSSTTPTTWHFEGSSNVDGYTVEFTPVDLDVTTNIIGDYTTTMICRDGNGEEVFDAVLTIKVYDPSVGFNISVSDGTTPIQTDKATIADEGGYYEFIIPPSSTPKTYVLSAETISSADTSLIVIRSKEGNLLGSSVEINTTDSADKLLEEYIITYKHAGSSGTFQVNVRVKTGKFTADTSSVVAKMTLPDGTVFETTGDPIYLTVKETGEYSLTFVPASQYANAFIELSTDNVSATASSNTLTFNISDVVYSDTVLLSGKITCHPNADATGTSTKFDFQVVQTPY